MDVTQYVAIAVVLVTIILMFKQHETRLILAVAGLVLCLISGDYLEAFTSFGKGMVSGAVILPICASMGFAYVMRYTGCDEVLVKALSKPMAKLGVFLIPATVMATFFVNTAIISAAGCSAAVGATFIPLLLAARVHKATAGAAVFAGTFGSLLSPGLGHNPYIGEMVGMTPIEVIKFHAPYTITAAVIGAIALTIVAVLRKEHRIVPSLDAAEQNAAQSNDGSHQLNPVLSFLRMITPFVPLVLLLLSSFTHVFGEVKLDVVTAMLIGSIYAFIVTFKSPGGISKSFFNGMGSSYGEVIGLIIAAGVFVQGLTSSGLINEFIELLKSSTEIARWGGTVGPFLLGVLTGSGEAAAWAFNKAVTPHAGLFGYQSLDLGMAAAIAGALGRTMSPVAGGAIVCAGIAGVSPIELAKRTAPGMVIALFFVAFVML